MAQRMLLKPLVWQLLRVTVSGRENLKGFKGAAVVVSNHSSHLDTPLIMGALPRRLGTSVATGAASDYFFQVRWRKPLTTLFFNAFPIDRSGTRGRNGLTTNLLDNGVPILLYPEGGRSKTGAMSTFKSGTAALCISRGVPVLPFALVGAYEAMPKGKFWPRAGRPPVHVVIGKPMDPEPGETPRAFSRRIHQAVRALFDEHAIRLGLPNMDERDREIAADRTAQLEAHAGSDQDDPVPFAAQDASTNGTDEDSLGVQADNALTDTVDADHDGSRQPGQDEDAP